MCEGPYLSSCRGVCLFPMPSHFPRPSTSIWGWGLEGGKATVHKMRSLCVGEVDSVVYNQEAVEVTKKDSEGREIIP